MRELEYVYGTDEYDGVCFGNRGGVAAEFGEGGSEGGKIKANDNDVAVSGARSTTRRCFTNGYYVTESSYSAVLYSNYEVYASISAPSIYS